MNKLSTDELLRKTGIANKYLLTRLAIQRMRQLVREKDKRSLEKSKNKLPTLVLKEIAEGKVKMENLELKYK
ncbi:DNA-directed RNA polymerase subunit omega [Candidatus Aerophobetes bacterium]|uniref:DNA-directed RNA polymerase subunit omega n=1 Tax=Aerophobetes bacterium TaxID=2030807 RepID=A0A523UTY0_UNCAE|nr:MAG: DNA-directed RNA polymerase subunit omega [Candidatus Aerophobetes bacterium]